MFMYVFLVLLFAFFGVIAGSLIKSVRIVDNGSLLAFASLIIFGFLVISVLTISKLFVEIAVIYKTLLILFAVFTFLTEAVIDKIFLGGGSDTGINGAEKN